MPTTTDLHLNYQHTPTPHQKEHQWTQYYFLVGITVYKI